MAELKEYYQEIKSGDELAFYFCGWEKCGPGHSFGPAVRPHFLFHFVLSGKGHYDRAGERYELEAGQGFLILPGESTCYQADWLRGQVGGGYLAGMRPGAGKPGLSGQKRRAAAQGDDAAGGIL